MKRHRRLPPASSAPHTVPNEPGPYSPARLRFDASERVRPGSPRQSGQRTRQLIADPRDLSVHRIPSIKMQNSSGSPPVSAVMLLRTVRSLSASRPPPLPNHSTTSATSPAVAFLGTASTWDTNRNPVSTNHARVRSSRNPASSGISAAASSHTMASASASRLSTHARGRNPKNSAIVALASNSAVGPDVRTRTIGFWSSSGRTAA